MWIELSTYPNGNTKVMLCNSGFSNKEISTCIERLPEGVAYISAKYLEFVKGYKKYKAENNNKYHTAYVFA